MSILDRLAALSDERFLTMYSSLEHQGFGPLDAEVAKSLNFRPQAVRKLPMAQRARRARSIVLQRKNGELAYELVGGYLVKTRREMITGFLDAVGVPHEDGMIDDVNAAPPDPARVAAAVEALDAKHPKEDVVLYLELCAQHWPESAEIAAALAARRG